MGPAMAPGAVFYASTGREKKMANFSCEDTARLGNAKDKDEPSAELRAGTPSTAGVQPGPTRADPAVPVPAPRPRRLS